MRHRLCTLQSLNYSKTEGAFSKNTISPDAAVRHILITNIVCKIMFTVCEVLVRLPALISNTSIGLQNYVLHVNNSNSTKYGVRTKL